MERRIGLSHFWAGRHAEALATLDSAMASAGGDLSLVGRVRMARGVCLYMLGRGSEARAELEDALGVAEKSGDPALLSRVHRALLLFHAWSGAPAEAREHGLRAVALAEESGNLPLAGACHWALAVVAGLTGQAPECAHHLAEGTRLADELRSPLLRLAFDEVAVEYASSVGRWDDGIALGEKAIAMARALNQQTVLPRLLVWTGLIYLGRHELERARAHLEEAWQLSGARDPGRAGDIHSVIPSHMGLSSYHLVAGYLDEAVRIADRTGYTIWAIHRLLAVLGEACLRKRQLEQARRCGQRLRSDAESIGHVLGIAWADSCYAARIRRQLAGRLADLGDRDGALRELRGVHDIVLALSAQEELRLTRHQFHQLDARPSVRPSGPGAEGLTGRELEIIDLIAARRSNKAIGQALGISPRTVTTHLSNIYQKLAIS